MGMGDAMQMMMMNQMMMQQMGAQQMQAAQFGAMINGGAGGGKSEARADASCSGPGAASIQSESYVHISRREEAHHEQTARTRVRSLLLPDHGEERSGSGDQRRGSRREV